MGDRLQLQQQSYPLQQQNQQLQHVQQGKMAYTGPAGMMMAQQPPVTMGMPMPPQGAYQIPYPSAPPTPAGYPMSATPAAPPATVMYPYSGTSTPINPNARSPARSRKATSGMQHASDWLSQHHPHLAGPGSQGPGSAYGSPAPSVMSMAMMSTMGLNDDAMSVMSGTTNLVELKPAASHQTENVDPAQLSAFSNEASMLATALIGNNPGTRPQAAENLARLLRRVKLPRESFLEIVPKTLQCLVQCEYPQFQLDPPNMSKLVCRLFDILYSISDISFEMRDLIVNTARVNQAFKKLIELSCAAMYPSPDPLNSKTFLLTICFLNKLMRDERSDHSRQIKAHLRDNKETFSFIFTQMINTQFPTSFEFMVRLLSSGNRRLFKEKLNENKIRMLLGGISGHPGIFDRQLRKKDETAVHNVLKIVELLVRIDSASVTQLEDDIQRFFIQQNVFTYLKSCIETKKPKFVQPCMSIYASLTSSTHLTDDMKRHMMDMIIEVGIHQVDVKTQAAIIFTLFGLSHNHEGIQRKLSMTQCFNYSCHLIQCYATPQNFADRTKADMMDTALKFCVQQLRLDVDKPEKVELWNDPSDNSIVSLFFTPQFATALLNLLVGGVVELKLRSLRVMVAALQLPVNRFSAFLFSAFDSIKGENISAAVFRTVNDAMISNNSAPWRAIIEPCIDMLLLLVQDAAQLNCLRVLAKSSSSHFPVNLLFAPGFIESSEVLAGKLLRVCKELVEDQELQQLWAQYREQFNALTVNGNYDISTESSNIVYSLGTVNEADSDFSIAFANGICG